MPTSHLPWNAKEATVGELADRAGVATSALRFYEREGLIHSRRTSGNQRRYSRDTLRRVAFIRASQRLGMPLSAIREVLSLLPDSRTPTKEDWAKVSECWRADLDERIVLMQQLRDNLTDCIGCGCLSIDVCVLVNPYDQLGEEGPGARRLAQPCLSYEDTDPCGQQTSGQQAGQPVSARAGAQGCQPCREEEGC
ncbi:redox-sensitive transcriptional activator SoxR [Streptomyces oceani]|uniref:redox-sensitive transcriptional activator SoxR n=1 Tax=Streptomyces oceani TaxID=1075402 RepID=UPI0009A0E248|nr:redox-sensitive transcriptional activator SoxR [Streptomyces oceani]